MLAEDERKLQTKRFVRLREWKPKGGNHSLMIVDIEDKAVSTEKLRLFLLLKIVRCVKRERASLEALSYF